MVFRHAYILPIVGFFWFPVTFIITYAVAVCNEDVLPLMPYISDTGTWSPESCIFGQMLNMGALLMAVVIYIRYRQVEYINGKNDPDKKVQQWNFLSLVAGIITSVGISIVGNFQETNILSVHLVGSGLTFGIGNIYQWIQTWISFKLYPQIGGKKANYGRLVCATISFITNSGTSFCGIISFLQFTGSDFTKWKPEDGGYVLHFASAVNEWILVMATAVFFLFFAQDFKSIVIEEPKVFVTTSGSKEATEERNNA